MKITNNLYMKFIIGVLAGIFFSVQIAAQTNPQAVKGKVVYGIASFYSKNLDGTKTSTGERYRHKNYTGASNNFKLNTLVRVTNLRNGKTVIVRINDRMHKKMAKKGRVIDLSRTAAASIGLNDKRGLTRVKVEAVPKDTKE